MSFVKTTAAVIVFTPLTASIMWFALGFAPSKSCAAPAAMASAPENVIVLSQPDQPDFEELIKLMPSYVRGPIKGDAPKSLPPTPRQKPQPPKPTTMEDLIALAEAGL